MAVKSKPDGIILAGGASSRMGTPKALMPLGGGLLIEIVIARAAPQVARLAIDVPRSDLETYRARFGDMAIADRYDDTLGPLCGIVTGLEWAATDWLASFPCDTPFLPSDLVAQLSRSAGDGPVLARHEGQLHGVFGLWPRRALQKLKAGLADGSLRSIRDALLALNGTQCEIAAAQHAFFNVNAPEDLEEAERLSG